MSWEFLITSGSEVRLNKFIRIPHEDKEMENMKEQLMYMYDWVRRTKILLQRSTGRRYRRMRKRQYSEIMTNNFQNWGKTGTFSFQEYDKSQVRINRKKYTLRPHLHNITNWKEFIPFGPSILYAFCSNFSPYFCVSCHCGFLFFHVAIRWPNSRLNRAHDMHCLI